MATMLLSATYDAILQAEPAEIVGRLRDELVRAPWASAAWVRWTGTVDESAVALTAKLPWHRPGAGCRVTGRLHKRAGVTVLQANIRPSSLQVAMVPLFMLVGVTMIATGQREPGVIGMAGGVWLAVDVWITQWCVAQRLTKVLTGA